MKSLGSYIVLVKSHLVSNVFALRDFRTNRHIIVFESDDWGSIRMSNKRAWDELLKMGYAVDKRPYERCDTLESAEDLEALFEVLRKYKDCKGRHPIITANMLMANPDFERIGKSGFQNYYYEPIANTYTRYFGDTKVLELMRQGYEEGLLMPQSHGREHFNVAQWIKGLQMGDEDMLTAFNLGMCGIAPKAHPEHGNKVINALRADDEIGQSVVDGIVAEGLDLFEQMWKFKSKTFVAPCYVWNEATEKILSDKGVELIQSSRVKKEAFRSPMRHLYSGQRTKLGQIYSIRNCEFEPTTLNTTVDQAMSQVDKSFHTHKIAVFSTHRINYVCGIDNNNRKKTLDNLDAFLATVIRKYPDVEFMSSDQLLDVFI